MDMRWTHDIRIYITLRMTLPDLEAFVALAETGSIKRAAIHLGLTQPATTRRVQHFEASMRGVVLLDRSVKPAVLTQAGLDVLSHCRRILKTVADLEELASGRSSPMGELRIGVSPGLAAATVSSPFDDLRRQFPGVQLRITSQWSHDLIRSIQGGALDCVVALLTEHHTLPSGVSGTEIGIEPIAVVAPRDLSLLASSKRSLLLKDLGNVGWVLNPAGCGYREALIRACDRAGVACRIVADVLGYDLQLGLVAKGAALGVVPRRLIGKDLLRQHLRMLDLADFAPKVRITILRTTALGSLNAPVDVLQGRLSSIIKNNKLA
jgi:DNA-binding transcriptional LysR family regulator